MKSLQIVFDSRASFFDYYLADLEGGGVFARTADGFEAGERVSLSLVFPEIPEGLRFRGEVAWRRVPTPWRSVLVPGVGVAFGRSQRSQVEFLMDFCRGRLAASRKKGRRVPADFRVDIVSNQERISGRARDVSRGGLFVAVQRLLDKGTEVDLDLFLEREGPPERFVGRVAWKHADGSDSGLGMEILFRTPYRRALISDFVGKIEGRLDGATARP
jgi:Tfp pilus assembly protein PilZ